MSDTKVKALLQKIQYIETDMEMQKQIVFSIPSDQKDDIKRYLEQIAGLKQQIHDLRQEIKQIDPAAYDRLIAIENGTRQFQEISKQKKFVHVNSMNTDGQCSIMLNDGTTIECLVAAREADGNWTILTLTGDVKHYPAGLIKTAQ